MCVCVCVYHPQALIDYGIVLLVPGKQDIDLKVLINRALLYLELGDHESALQVPPLHPSIYISISLYPVLILCSVARSDCVVGFQSCVAEKP